jgi:protein O-GlcNAc transferase
LHASGVAEATSPLYHNHRDVRYDLVLARSAPVWFFIAKPRAAECILKIEETLQLAVEHQQAGRLVEAHSLYKKVLEIDPDEPDALRLMGQLTFQSGNLKKAAQLIRRAIELRPNVIDFHLDLARILMAMGDFHGVVANLRKALKLDPFSSPETHFELARALAAIADNDEAMKHVEIAIEKNPTADAIALQGGLLLTTGRVQQAVDRLQQAIGLAPDRADLLSTYALALQHRGDFDLAEQTYRKALHLKPEFAEVRNSLGYLLVLRRQLPQAIVELERTIKDRPVFPQAHYHLALAYTGMSRTEEALASFRIALEQEPRMPDGWEAVGRVLLDSRKYKEAVTAFTRAISLGPTAQRYILLSIAHAGLEDLDGAIAATRKAVALEPNSADTHDALGGELKWAGQLEEGLAELRRALELNPHHAGAHSKIVYGMLMQDGPTPEEILAAHVQWGVQQTGSIVPLRRPRNTKLPDRRLRVGYISNNFRSQAVSLFVLPILQHHDREQVEIYCYSDIAVPDAVTARFRGYANHWRDSSLMNDEQLARQIREDRIDILVELTGHIGKGRLIALAYHPAPVQISYIGYQGTTGVPAVDYVLTDEWADPIGVAEKNYVEKPYRLPGSFFVYEPFPGAPLVAPSPARNAGFIMFGCLNAVQKSTARAVRLWGRVLAGVPNSRMMILTTRCVETNARLLSQFAAAGIGADRIQLVQRTRPDEYYRRYNSIDIALDPVPFNGHTTTCDAAWMGVPTVTLSGQIYAHRFGGSVLRNLDLPGMVTESEESYVAAAIDLANDLDRLAKLRSSLRFTMQASLITDGKRFTKNLENAYREMWRTWCARAD